MTDNKFALIKDGAVFNTIIWDGESEIDFGTDITSTEIPEGSTVSIGYLYDGKAFTAPEKTDEEKSADLTAIKQANISAKSSLMDEANNKVSVLQDAVDLEMATTDEAASLPLWKKYRVLLNRVDANTSDEITWPQKPA